MNQDDLKRILIEVLAELHQRGQVALTGESDINRVLAELLSSYSFIDGLKERGINADSIDVSKELRSVLEVLKDAYKAMERSEFVEKMQQDEREGYLWKHIYANFPGIYGKSSRR